MYKKFSITSALALLTTLLLSPQVHASGDAEVFGAFLILLLMINAVAGGVIKQQYFAQRLDGLALTGSPLGEGSSPVASDVSGPESSLEFQ